MDIRKYLTKPPTTTDDIHFTKITDSASESQSIGYQCQKSSTDVQVNGQSSKNSCSIEENSLEIENSNSQFPLNNTKKVPNLSNEQPITIISKQVSTIPVDFGNKQLGACQVILESYPTRSIGMKYRGFNKGWY